MRPLQWQSQQPIRGQRPKDPKTQSRVVQRASPLSADQDLGCQPGLDMSRGLCVGFISPFYAVYATQRLPALHAKLMPVQAPFDGLRRSSRLCDLRSAGDLPASPHALFTQKCTQKDTKNVVAVRTAAAQFGGTCGLPKQAARTSN